MRGDFFKTCFCLVELQKGINSPNEKYVSIASTKYNEDMTNYKFDARRVLSDLIKTMKQSKDFIFRTFIENNNIYIPQSIDTGKAETIIVNKEKLKTLDRFRLSLNNNASDGKVVKSIENERGKRKFSTIEQALAHINTQSELGLNLKASEETLRFEEELKRILEEELKKDISSLTYSRKR